MSLEDLRRSIKAQCDSFIRSVDDLAEKDPEWPPDEPVGIGQALETYRMVSSAIPRVRDSLPPDLLQSTEAAYGRLRNLFLEHRNSLGGIIAAEVKHMLRSLSTFLEGLEQSDPYEIAQTLYFRSVLHELTTLAEELSISLDSQRRELSDLDRALRDYGPLMAKIGVGFAPFWLDF